MHQEYTDTPVQTIAISSSRAVLGRTFGKEIQMGASQNPNRCHPSDDERNHRSDAIDLTDGGVAAEGDTFHVDDRVQRLNGGSEESRWGTITGRIDSAQNDWLVVDNVGVTHRDNAAQLCPAQGCQ
jgi:hypothetical protein